MKSSQKIAIARRSLAALAHVCRAMCACCDWLRHLANAPGPAKLGATGGSLDRGARQSGAKFAGAVDPFLSAVAGGGRAGCEWLASGAMSDVWRCPEPAVHVAPACGGGGADGCRQRRTGRAGLGLSGFAE